MTSSSTSSPLPDPNRYITTNDEHGKSTFSQAHPSAVPVVNDLNGAVMRLAYVTPHAGPVALTNDADLSSYSSSLQNLPPLVPSGGGTIFWYIDTPPSSASPKHRTVSVDFIIQLEGEIELTLEDGATRVLKPGDVVVQRSTMHTWRNVSATRWSRLLAIMSECQPVEAGGKTLGAEFLS